MNFCDKLNMIRKQLGLSQDELAIQIGVNRRMISKWELGIAYPDLNKIQVLCNLFHIDADVLLNPQIEEINVLPQTMFQIDPSQIGPNIRKIRNERGIRQEMFAELLEVSRQSVSKWESGAVIPKTETLIAILPILQTSFSELFETGAVINEQTPSAVLEEEPHQEPPVLPEPEAINNAGYVKRKKGLWIIAIAAVLLVLSIPFTIFLISRYTDLPGSSQPAGTDEQPGQPPENDAPTVTVWNGSADTSWYVATRTEFTLTTAEQLAGLAQLVNSGLDSFERKTVILESDILLTQEKQWTPIGDTVHPFRGNFIGTGHKISGMHIDSWKNAVGLFGMVSGANISGIILENGMVEGRESVGGLCGLIQAKPGYKTVVSECYAKDLTVEGDQKVGGLIGEISSQSCIVEIRDCGFSGSVAGLASAGGICGKSRSTGANANVLISSCSNNGKVKVFSKVRNEEIIIESFGGIAGTVEALDTGKSQVQYCVGAGEVCNGLEAQLAGGIVGYLCTKTDDFRNGSAMISDCYHTGTVCSNTKKSEYVGGIVGQARPYEIRIERCYHSGSVTAKGYCGGIVGFFTGVDEVSVIRECVSVGKIISTLGWIDWNFIGSDQRLFLHYASFGGIAGAVGNTISRHVLFSKCYVSGQITAQSKGGIAGWLQDNDGYMSECCYSSDAATDYSYFGVWKKVAEMLPPDQLTNRIIFSQKLNWKSYGWDVTGELPVLKPKT